MKIMFVIFMLIIHSNSFESDSEKCEDFNAMVKCVTDTGYKFCFNYKTYGRVYNCGPEKKCNATKSPYCFAENQDVEDIYKDIYVPDNIKKRVAPSYIPEVAYCLNESLYKFIQPICSSYDLQLTLIPYTGCKLFSICGDINRVKVAKCPEGSYFNGFNCSKDYVCPFPCQNIIYASVEKNYETAKHKILNEGFKRWPIDNSSCRSFMEVFIDSNLNTITVEKQCPPNSWFDPVIKLCRMGYYCEDNPHTARRCLDKKIQTVCNPEFEIPSCKRGYTYKIVIPSTGCHFYLFCNRYPQVKQCLPGKLFNNNTGQCEFNYKCPYSCKLYKDVFNEKPLEEQPMCTFYYENKSTGIVKNSYCGKYAECSQGDDPNVKDCPVNLFYDPRKRTCLPGYKCPEYECVPIPLGDS